MPGPDDGERSRHAGTSLRGTLLWTLAVAVGVVALRAPLAGAFAFPDEGGMLLVARHWDGGGPGLYGSFFVDRPPLEVLFWRLADVLGGVTAARWLATAGVVVLVGSAAWAGQLLGGARGARWAGLVAAAVGTTPLLGTQEVDGELLGAPLVMVACALTLAAARRADRARGGFVLAFAAGVAAAAAVLVKQNLAGGLVFAAVLAAVSVLDRRWRPRAAAGLLVAGLAGVALPVLATVVWADRGPGVGTLWYTLFGFRGVAADVIATQDMAAPDRRLELLGILALVSGLVPLLAVYLWRVRRLLLARDPVTVAIVAVAVTELVGVALGGSYWPHYLVALAPTAALAAGAMPRLTGPRRGPRAAVVLVAGSALVAALVADAPVAPSLRSDEGGLVAWLARAHRPGDTAFVAYGHPDIVEASGLRPARYPYLWSLPMRVEDPRLTRLEAVLSGPDRPTWLVAWTDLDAWAIDAHGAVAGTVATRYRPVGSVCGTPVYLRDDVRRVLPARPPSC